jgi:hypothetical protein
LIRNGKKAVIVAQNECSLSKIYLERQMDYFIFPTVEEVNEKAFELIINDKHDFIVNNNGNYDSTMHKNGPDAPVSIEALKYNISMFDSLAQTVKASWGTKHTTLLGFAPDHGCHEIDGGGGGHGLDMPSDLNIAHFYGII